ncbi:unnamed protein product [marine sediment metagenome]|uniref:Uncharacterized protein n=1 Tax=marine sediment metagenome TaxID=412755 RepID=X1CS86_9ZZZZ
MIGKMIFVAVILGMVFTSVGLGISYQANLPSGATIILCAGMSFLLALGLKKIIKGRYHAST